MRRRSHHAGLTEVWIVWLLFGLSAIAVFETYWRIPPQDLWKVTNTGFVGGAGRAFVFVSFSAALAAVAVLGIVSDRLEDRRADLVALVSLILCATVAYPGVQTESHLDPKWSNTYAVVGVVLAVALTVWAAGSGRPERVRTSLAGDRARLVVGGVSLFFAAPYIAAELGFFLDGVPVLGWIFQTGKITPEPGSGDLHAAVHHGHHHGMDGFLLAVTALLLSRQLGGIRRPGAADADRCLPLTDARLWADQPGRGSLDRADRQARLDDLADSERPPSDGLCGLDGDGRCRGAFLLRVHEITLRTLA